jgi:hypothetical protein
MPYRRPKEIPTEAQLVAQFERAIRCLVRRFRNHPYAFYTETDMHCYLWHRLYRPPFNLLFKTSEGFDTLLLHKEFPTKARYRRQDDKTLKNDLSARRRGHFDVSIWDPKYVSSRGHRKQQVLCAAELALNECGQNNVHTINDATKLADPQNELKHGSILYFVRDDPTFEDNCDYIWKQLNDAAQRVNVAFAHVDGELKPKPQFLGNWITE